MRAAGSGDHGSLSRRWRQVQMWGPGAQVRLPLTHLSTPQVGQLQRREHCCIIFHSFPSPKIVNSSSTERVSVEKGHSLVFTDQTSVKTDECCRIERAESWIIQMVGLIHRERHKLGIPFQISMLVMKNCNHNTTQKSMFSIIWQLRLESGCLFTSSKCHLKFSWHTVLVF